MRSTLEIVRVDNSTRESVNPREVRYNGNREVTRRHYDVIKPLGWKNSVLWKVFDNHCEVIGGVVVSHLANNMVKTNPRTKIIFGPTA